MPESMIFMHQVNTFVSFLPASFVVAASAAPDASNLATTACAICAAANMLIPLSRSNAIAAISSSRFCLILPMFMIPKDEVKFKLFFS